MNAPTTMRMLAAALTCIFWSPSASAELVFWKNVADWRISRETDNPYCAMTSSYEGAGNTFVYLSYTPAKDEAWLAITNEEWKSLDKGDDLILDYDLGSEKWSDVKTNVIETELSGKGFSSLFVARDFLADFAAAPSLKILRGDTIIDKLSLKGTATAIHELVTCAHTLNKGLLKDPFAD